MSSCEIPAPETTGCSIVHVLLGSEGGGIITAIRQFSPMLIKAGWDMRFVVLGASSKAVSMLQDAGLNAVVLNASKRDRLPKLLSELESCPQVVLHTHNPAAHMLSLKAKRAIGCGTVRTIHADMFEEMRGNLPGWKIMIWKYLMAKAWRQTDIVTAVSPHLIDLLPGSIHDRKKIIVMPNGFDPATIEANTDTMPKEIDDWLNMPNSASGQEIDTKLVLSMGRLVPVKNYRLLLSAFAKVVQVIPEAKLLLAGSGPLLSDLESQRADLGLDDCVMFLSWVDQIAPLLKRASVVAISSHSECCPMLVLEAMSASTPCVATAVGGIPAMVTDGETACLVPSGDTDALASAIFDMLKNEKLADTIGAAGRAHLDDLFGLPLVARRHAAIYNAVIRGDAITEVEVLQS